MKKDKERTRIIVFATDNDVQGKETVSLEEACSLCNKYNINLYAYCPTYEMNRFATEEKIAKYKNAIEKNAGGKFYTGDLESMVSNIVNEIKETKTSLLKANKKTFITDHPEILVVSIILMFCMIIIVEKIIKI